MACVPVMIYFLPSLLTFWEESVSCAHSLKELFLLVTRVKGKKPFLWYLHLYKRYFFLQIIVLCDYFSMHGDKLNQWPSERLRGTPGPRNVDHKSFVWEENANKSKLCYKGWSQNRKQVWPNGLSPVERLSRASLRSASISMAQTWKTLQSSV